MIFILFISENLVKDLLLNQKEQKRWKPKRFLKALLTWAVMRKK